METNFHIFHFERNEVYKNYTDILFSKKLKYVIGINRKFYGDLSVNFNENMYTISQAPF